MAVRTADLLRQLQLLLLPAGIGARAAQQQHTVRVTPVGASTRQLSASKLDRRYAPMVLTMSGRVASADLEFLASAMPPRYRRPRDKAAHAHLVHKSPRRRTSPAQAAESQPKGIGRGNLLVRPVSAPRAVCAGPSC